MPEKLAKMAGALLAKVVKFALFSSVFWGMYLLIAQ